MNTELKSLIERQYARMQTLREDVHDLANTVADEVWDKFEVEIEEATEDGYMFDFAASTQMALASMLSLSYDEAFERHVLGFFERQENELRDVGTGQVGFDNTRIDLAGLRKCLKLRRHADDLINQAIERAKPGLIGTLLLSSDPCSKAWDREHGDNARRLRRRLLDLRGPLTEQMREETTCVIHAGRLAYIERLDALSRKLAKA